MKKLAIFGGSFNPPLNSHFSIAEQILNEIEDIEKVVFVPVSENYGKPGLLSDKHRYEMLNRVISKNDRFILDDVEMKFAKYVNTIVTMRALREKYSDYELYYVAGTDNLKAMSEWDEIDPLLDEFKVIIMNRDYNCFDEIIDNDEYLKKHKDRFIPIVEGCISNLSSTFVRNKLKEGNSVRYLMPDEVFEYINENNLYKN